MLRSIRFSLCIAIVSFQFVEAASTAGKKPRPRDTVKVSATHEKIIEGALKYLASKQKSNGSWGENSEERRHPVAITGYTLIAFQSGGNLPG